ncbi:hypothetical protein EX30DRAFT_341060 [Ascodesmis nigricans]|uniref:LYC1 C-terminal domain-containing protein n=1 Tax=Ascodesmis nigricans TaxID=341454 RepID=A0A4S2MWT9_9PEZI|nr:hypothetical protein EX30DRAFT_341060 [Ascodesmis nigricans]
MSTPTKPGSETTSQSQYYFRRATPGEKIICWTRNHAAWGGLLTEVTQYIAREVVNSTTPMTIEGQKHWVLSTRPDPPQDGEESAEDLLAACETLERPAFVVGTDGKTQIVKSVGIASVFTPAENRGKGYAGVMMMKLAEWLDEQDVAFSVLYSDVGKEFYDKRGGWKAFESRQVVLNLKDTNKGAEQISTHDAVELFRTESVVEVCAKDVPVLQHKMKGQPLGRNNEFRVAVVPSFDIISWHFGSEEYTGKIITDKKPEIKGAKSGDVAITWVHDYNKNLLFILRVSYLSKADEGKKERVGALAGLLDAAVSEAQKWGFKAVVAWNPDEQLSRAAEQLGKTLGSVDVVFEDRDKDNIPALRWEGAQHAGKIEWWDIVKYTWC